MADFPTRSRRPSIGGAKPSRASQVNAKLARLPSGEQNGSHAGMTFAVPRNLRRSPAFSDLCMVVERIQELRQGAAILGLGDVVEDLVGIEADLSPTGSTKSASPGL